MIACDGCSPLQQLLQSGWGLGSRNHKCAEAEHVFPRPHVFPRLYAARSWHAAVRLWLRGSAQLWLRGSAELRLRASHLVWFRGRAELWIRALPRAFA